MAAVMNKVQQPKISSPLWAKAVVFWDRIEKRLKSDYKSQDREINECIEFLANNVFKPNKKDAETPDMDVPIETISDLLNEIESETKESLGDSIKPTSSPSQLQVDLSQQTLEFIKKPVCKLWRLLSFEFFCFLFCFGVISEWSRRCVVTRVSWCIVFGNETERYETITNDVLEPIYGWK